MRRSNDGIIPSAGQAGDFDENLKEIALGASAKVEEAMEKSKFNVALEEIWVVVRRANKYIDETTPWILAKDEANKGRLMRSSTPAESLSIVSALIHPFMHTTSGKIREQPGLAGEPKWDDSKVYEMTAGEKVQKGDPIFPRMDIDKELAELDELSGKKEETLELKAEIQYDDFAKLDFRVGTVLECEKHPKADKLLVFQVKVGPEVRQIISGVAGSHKPEEVIGQKVVVVANLAPRKLRGLESNGMILFADNVVDGKERFEFVSTVAEDGNPVT